MDKKYVVSAFLPFVVIIVYAIIFKINVLHVISEDPKFFLLFLASYLGQNIVTSFKDSMITRLKIGTTTKGRLVGNSTGLLIPGWAGQELARSLVYNKYGLNLRQAFSYSILVGSIDVLGICVGYLLFLPIYFNPLEIIFIIVTVSNIVGWGLALSYFYFQSSKLNRVESYLFRVIKMEHIATSYLEFKSYLREGTNKELIIYTIISILSFTIYGIYFYYITHNIILSIFISFLYQASTLIPIPSAAIVGELALSIFLNPSYVFITRLNYIVCNMIGFAFFKDMHFEELKKWSKEVLKR
ncbi:hypothetical protein BFU36_04330 [Sulfolobus sp. A20]|uniref:hypothetical protein n=1 Tax=Saccharolobus sp. A20 TaxID=1891280 RepID=UPI000845CD55|nr:hypothetical protein [Sulfolobus sp. A20]TRM79299.1 hypothetical protein DJ528_01820 [Sulfolobus sp. B5]TRM82157.1 hypothetical protein DJ524_01600 [Sulfolobus sp. D5]TRM88525.1 hypothetical protein DJ521_01690 [Sulfolobus sp. E3]TRM99903.1 hypothetical protein DJ527_07980 [Sulfolobus sp. F1]AOL16079.1 hypothetical protein BFU36_04330 [Sulfolobus sp. A20]